MINTNMILLGHEPVPTHLPPNWYDPQSQIDIGLPPSSLATIPWIGLAIGFAFSSIVMARFPAKIVKIVRQKLFQDVPSWTVCQLHGNRGWGNVHPWRDVTLARQGVRKQNCRGSCPSCLPGCRHHRDRPWTWLSAIHIDGRALSCGVQNPWFLCGSCGQVSQNHSKGPRFSRPLAERDISVSIMMLFTDHHSSSADASPVILLFCERWTLTIVKKN